MRAPSKEVAQTFGRATKLAPLWSRALREPYERLQDCPVKASFEELLAIAARAAAHIKRPYLDHAEFLRVGVPEPEEGTIMV